VSWAGRDVAWSELIEHDLGRLESQIANHIIQAVEQYAMTGRGDVRRLQVRVVPSPDLR